MFMLVVFLPKLGLAIDGQSAEHTSAFNRLAPQTPSSFNSSEDPCSLSSE
jgi:hypothetical protein